MTTSATVLHGDCIELMRAMPDNSIDAIVTDPPYGLGFMGKAWDDLPPGLPWAQECFRVLKPGGHLLAFGGTRTWHRLAVAVEDAGFEVRDSIAWLYGSGFPKSLDVSKAIDKVAGKEPIVLGPDEYRRARANRGTTSEIQPSYDKPRIAQAEANLTAPATPDAERWQGWGTALKPAFEPIVVARKPLVGTVAANVLAHGTGALNVDACRVGYQSNSDKASARPQGAATSRVGALAGKAQTWTATQTERSTTAETTGTSVNSTEASAPSADGTVRTGFTPKQSDGRWPANVLLDGSQADAINEQSGVTVSRVGKPRSADSGDGWGMTATGTEYDDQGGASRFFPTFRYQAKAPTRERVTVGGVAHPTVKPLELMRWLVRLVTPPGGTVLDPFAGSGTTGEAAVLEGFDCILIERTDEYLPLIERRIERAGLEVDVEPTPAIGCRVCGDPTCEREYGFACMRRRSSRP